MEYIKDKKGLEETEYYMGLALKEAKKSTCKKSKRGAVIVKNGKVIGKGYNKTTIKKFCNPCIRMKIHDNSRAELCPAIHAEQMAILDALKKKKNLKGARMYHIKVKNGKVIICDDLSCTVCSRLQKDVGVEFVLLQDKGYALFKPEEYNKLSFDYFLNN
jgi:dCMP deaminase